MNILPEGDISYLCQFVLSFLNNIINIEFISCCCMSFAWVNKTLSFKVKQKTSVFIPNSFLNALWMLASHIYI